MHPFFVQHLFYFPTQRLIAGNARKAIRFHKILQHQPKDLLEEYQGKALCSLLEYAFLHIPYYRQVGANAGDVRTEKPHHILQRLPVVSKEDIRRQISLFEDPQWRKWWRTTSGTSGTPFRFFKDRVALINMDAAMFAAYSWYHIGVGDRQARLWGQAVPLPQHVLQLLKDFLLNRRRLSAFAMTPQKSLRYHESLKKFRPTFFYCYPNAAFLFAQHLQNTHMQSFPKPKAVICTGEPLLDAHRLALRKLFSCPIVNEYGTTENGILAFECEQGGMHILSDNVIVEFLKDGKPAADGETGEVVVTELFSRSVPFIRYRTGDIGSPLFSRKCSCGRSLPLMQIILGREDNFIIRPDGEKVYDAILAYVLKEGVKQFRATQERIDKLLIEIVPDKDFNENMEKIYRRKLEKYLTGELRVEFKQVSEIPMHKNGKLQYFVSKVRGDKT